MWAEKYHCAQDDKYLWVHVTGLVVNNGISNMILLEIP